MKHWVLLLFIFQTLSGIQGLNILMIPLATAFNSHFLNFDRMADLLQSHGHDVTVLVSSRMKPLWKTQNVNFYEAQVPEEDTISTEIDPEIIEGQWRVDSIWSAYSVILRYTEFEVPYCEAVLKDADVLRKIEDQKFDLLIVDYSDDCAKILKMHFDLLIVDYSDDCAKILKMHFDIPTIVYNSLGLMSWQNNILYPIIPSFVCSGVHCYPDQMTFGQRVENVIQLLMGYFIIYPKCEKIFRQLQLKYNIVPDRSISNALHDSLMFVHVTFALDYPRPLMPNIIPLPGLHTAVKPLPSDLQEFLDNAPPEGAIVMSFGSMVSTFSLDVALKFSNVFSRLKQRVIWRYDGELTLGDKSASNIKLVGWFPQNDVLAHPNVKLFISHCGNTGTMEAMHHGIPILGFPLLGDQFFHIDKMVDRGFALRMDKNHFTEDQLHHNILELLNNGTYKKRAVEVSEIVNDMVISGQDLLLYYVKYVARHKGVKHMISSAAHELTTIQYLSLDVVAFISACCVTVLGALCLCLKFTVQSFLKSKKKLE